MTPAKPKPEKGSATTPNVADSDTPVTNGIGHKEGVHMVPVNDDGSEGVYDTDESPKTAA